MKVLIEIAALFFGAVAAIGGMLFHTPLRWPAPIRWFVKLYLSALSPFLVLLGMFVAIVGLATGSIVIAFIGFFTVAIYIVHILSVTRPPAKETNFETAFGADWKQDTKLYQGKFFLKNRLILRLPDVPTPVIKQNIPFATIPETGRQLLCDIWEPSKDVARSGLALIYLHGSAFYFLDKDFQTRPFFRQLAAQGHVVMDVAYRLFPETNIMGMVHDAKRAIAWMKENAPLYGNPDHIVISGGSAGGQLALLAAYTTTNSAFIPIELKGKNLEVAAVISMYGSSDLEALYFHTNQHLTTRSVPGRNKISVPRKIPGWIIKKMGAEYHRLHLDINLENAGAMPLLLGGQPDECPEKYAYFSVGMHVHPGCPPTLLIHDEHDIMAPVTSTLQLYQRLIENMVPTVMHIIPQTDHGFDLILPQVSPSAHNLIYDMEIFLRHISEATKRTPAKAGVQHLLKENVEALNIDS